MKLTQQIQNKIKTGVKIDFAFFFHFEISM